jgi:hypothetical protein
MILLAFVRVGATDTKAMKDENEILDRAFGDPAWPDIDDQISD